MQRLNSRLFVWGVDNYVQLVFMKLLFCDFLFMKIICNFRINFLREQEKTKHFQEKSFLCSRIEFISGYKRFMIRQDAIIFSCILKNIFHFYENLFKLK